MCFFFTTWSDDFFYNETNPTTESRSPCKKNTPDHRPHASSKPFLQNPHLHVFGVPQKKYQSIQRPTSLQTFARQGRVIFKL